MAYIEGNRGQMTMFPQSVEDFIDENDPVRVYDEFVESLDVERLGLKLNANKEGAPQYHPKSMLKVMLYGYSYGIRSSRKLERALYHNLTFIWLSGGLKPDHKTIALFRKRNRKILKNVFKQCVELCIKLDVIKGNTIYVDGTKIRANAGIKHTYNKRQFKAKLAALNTAINRMLNECDRVDKNEADLGSLVKLDEQLSTAKKRKVAIENALKEMSEEERAINLVDPDCKSMNGRQGSHAGYNAQATVDDENGLIVSCDVVNDSNDKHQLIPQLEQATEALGKPPKITVADKGYSQIDACHEVSKQSTQLVVPPIQYASSKVQAQEFGSSQFTYYEESNQYTCPEGHLLIAKGSPDRNKRQKYRISSPKLCLECPHFGRCTTSKKGRVIQRHLHQSTMDNIALFYESPPGQILYRKRGQKVELPFGHIKRNLGVSSFLLRGFSGVKAEMSILATCFNLRRLMTILGTQELRAHLNPG